jgi:hypothetical protein
VLSKVLLVFFPLFPQDIPEGFLVQFHGARLYVRTGTCK